jgi:hypothetical protein
MGMWYLRCQWFTFDKTNSDLVLGGSGTSGISITNEPATLAVEIFKYIKWKEHQVLVNRRVF